MEGKVFPLKPAPPFQAVLQLPESRAQDHQRDAISMSKALVLSELLASHKRGKRITYCWWCAFAHVNTDEEEVRLGQACRELAQWVIYSMSAQIKKADCPFGLMSTHVSYQARFV